MDHPSYCQIESLNAEAIQMIATGSYAEASKGLGRALRQLLPHVLNPREDDDRDNREVAIVVMQGVPLCSPVLSKTEERIFTIFSNAISCTQCKSEHTWKLEDYHRAAAATVYNMALSTHFQGLKERTGPIRRDCLKKALKAYEAARKLLEAVVEDDLARSTDDVKYLLLAIANNEGHISEQLSQLDRARECLRQLHFILPYTLGTEEFTHFLVTAILFPEPDHLPLHAPQA